MKLDGSILLSKERISHLKRRYLNFVFFPIVLESEYRQQYQDEAAYEFRYRAPIILFLYAFLSLGIYQVLPAEQVLPWFSYYGWVGVIIFIAWLLSFIKTFNQYFDYYTCIGSSGAVALTFIMITNLESGQNYVLFHAAMMYAVIIIYGFVGMRFYPATIAGWSGGFFAVIFTLIQQGHIEWTFLNRTYTFSSLLGMSLAYANDRQHRENYLQNCIIRLNSIELHDQAQKLSELSKRDALTHLSNRRHLDEMFEVEWKRALRTQSPISIIMIDIDYFKIYNDMLGHVAGDDCLRKIAHALNTNTSRSGEIVARYGGEEFLLLLPATTQHQATIQIKRLMTAIDSLHIPHPNNIKSPYVTISAGIATTIPKELQQIYQFIEQADQALYRAKINGRNQFYVATAQSS